MNKVKITLFDIETSPIKGYTWGIYDQNVLKVIEPSKIICAAWKDLNEKEVHCKALCDYKGYKPNVLDDQSMVEELWTVLDESDVVVAHNGDAFDIKKLNSRFISLGMKAPSAYKTVDTLKASKKHFRFDANSLDYLGGYLEEGTKMANGGFETWVKCMAGDMTAWAKMKKYNVQDIKLLENIYLRLRPFMDNHPNLNLFGDRPAKGELICGTCQSTNTAKRGFSITLAGRKQRFQCNDCGSWSSGAYQRGAVDDDDD